MRFRVTRIVFQRGRKTIKRFGRVSFLRFDNAEIAIGIGDAILLFNRLPVQLGGFQVPAFVQHQRLLKATQRG